jgi:hypothetical protein
VSSMRAQLAAARGAFQDSSDRLDHRFRFLCKMQGRCFNRLSPCHSITICHSQTKCWHHLCPGHISSSCHRPSPSSNTTPYRTSQQCRLAAQAPSPTSQLEHFDLSGRPEFDVCNLPFTKEIKDRIDFFESRSVIVCMGINRPFTDIGHVTQPFISHYGLHQSSIQVSCHYPPDLLVSIFDRDVLEEVTGLDSFPHGSR